MSKKPTITKTSNLNYAQTNFQEKAVKFLENSKNRASKLNLFDKIKFNYEYVTKFFEGPGACNGLVVEEIRSQGAKENYNGKSNRPLSKLEKMEIMNI